MLQAVTICSKPSGVRDSEFNVEKAENQYAKVGICLVVNNKLVFLK